MTDHIAEFQALYETTNNPLYAWQALALCAPENPLPAWVLTYLQSCARGPVDDGVGPEIPMRRGLLDLDNLHAVGKVTATEAGAAVARALGLAYGANGNAFADARNVEQDAAMAFHIDTRRGRKRWEAIQAQTGLSRTHIHERAQLARARWRAQDKDEPDK